MSNRAVFHPIAAIAGVGAMLMTITAAEAAMTPSPNALRANPSLQLTAGGLCGPGRDQGPNGVCHPEGWFAWRGYGWGRYGYPGYGSGYRCWRGYWGRLRCN